MNAEAQLRDLAGWLPTIDQLNFDFGHWEGGEPVHDQTSWTSRRTGAAIGQMPFGLDRQRQRHVPIRLVSNSQ